VASIGEKQRWRYSRRHMNGFGSLPLGRTAMMKHRRSRS
jgi:hypothetical protein